MGEAARWIHRDSPAAARRLRREVAVLARRLGEYPLIGVARPDMADPPYRFAVVRGFPYIAVYDSDRTPPVIMRVLHGARDLPEVLKDL